MQEEIADIVIVGAGPTGMLTALGLAQRGLDVIVLEAEPGVLSSPRAMVYHWAVLEGLDRLGVLGDMEARGYRNPNFMLRILETGEEIRLSHDPLASISPYPYNVHLGQHEVVKIAFEHLKRFPGARVRFEARAESVQSTDGGAAVHAQTPDGPMRVQGRWVLAADGARSTIRRSLGLSFDGITWSERFVATNIRFPFDRFGGYEDASMLLDPEHGCILGRIDKTGLWRWTWSESEDLSEETISSRIAQRFAALGLGTNGFEVDAFTPYRMHQRSVRSMRVNRVLLLGDAAHATNPTGGLGLTSAMFDLFALVDPLASVVSGGAPDSDLDRWSQERLAKFREIASPAAVAFKTLVYDERDLDVRRGAIEDGRQAARDPDVQRERLSLFKALETGLPSPGAR